MEMKICRGLGDQPLVGAVGDEELRHVDELHTDREHDLDRQHKPAGDRLRGVYDVMRKRGGGRAKGVTWMPRKKNCITGCGKSVSIRKPISQGTRSARLPK